MTIHKTILALLAVALAAIGTMTAVVHADEPDVADYMDDSTQVLHAELSGPGKEMIAEVWTNITATAPQNLWTELIQQFVVSFHKNEYGIRGMAAAVRSSGCTAYTGTAIRSGYAASHTGNSCTKAYLRVDLQVQGGGPGDLSSCFGCRSTYASVSFSSCNYYVAIGSHEWGYPTGGRGSSDDNYAAC